MITGMVNHERPTIIIRNRLIPNQMITALLFADWLFQFASSFHKDISSLIDFIALSVLNPFRYLLLSSFCNIFAVLLVLIVQR